MRVFVQTLIKFMYAINVSIVKSYHKILSALGYKITRLYQESAEDPGVSLGVNALECISHVLEVFSLASSGA